MFSLTVKAFVMFVRFLLIHRKGPKNNIHRDLFKKNHPKQKNPRPPAALYAPYCALIGFQPN